MLGMRVTDVLAMDAIEYRGYERQLLRGTMPERRLHYLLATIVSCITAFGGPPADVAKIAPWLDDDPPENPGVAQTERVMTAVLDGKVSF